MCSIRCFETAPPAAKRSGPIVRTAQTNRSNVSDSQHSSQIHARAYRNQPLSSAQELSNTAKSRVRARVEHVFSHMENSMGGIFLRTIGATRAAVGVGLMNLTYNLVRIEILVRTKVFSFDRVSAPEIRVAA